MKDLLTVYTGEKRHRCGITTNDSIGKTDFRVGHVSISGPP